MRPEELVRRADEHVAAPRGDVDRPVRAVVDGVDPGERAGLVGQLDDAADVRRRADGVRGRRERHDARPVGQLAREVVVVEREVVGHVDELDVDPDVALDLEPGRDVGVVIEARDERPRRPAAAFARGARQQEVQARSCSGRRRPRRGRSRGTTPRVRVQRRPGHPCDGTSRTARRCWRCPRAGSARSRRSPRRALRAAGPSKKASRRSRAVKRADRLDVEPRLGAHRPCPCDAPRVRRRRRGSAPTKQSRSAFASSSATVASSGFGSKPTSASTATRRTRSARPRAS